MDTCIETRSFWNEIGLTKTFKSPFYLEKLSSLVYRDQLVVDYGCGYGRILNYLHSHGYRNLTGYDYAPSMIEKGRKTYPHLNLHPIPSSTELPLNERTADLLILSMVLYCNPYDEDQTNMFKEIQRVLKRGGYLYFTDILLTDSEEYRYRYKHCRSQPDQYGVFLTSEGLTVRHHDTEWIFQLLKGFDVIWFEQFNHVTMNDNPVRTFHCIAKKR